MITSELTDIALVIHEENKVQMIFNNDSKKAESFIANIILLGNNLDIWLNALEQLQLGENCIITQKFANQKAARNFFNSLIKTFKTL